MFWHTNRTLRLDARSGSRTLIAVLSYWALLWSVFSPSARGQSIITTLAGADKSLAAVGVQGSSVNLFPYGSGAVDSSGNFYFVDLSVNKVLKLSPSGLLTAVAGNGLRGYSGDGGSALHASLYNPFGVAVDSSGNLFISDANNGRIRKVTSDGNISTIASGLSQPQGVAVDASGVVYIADTLNNRVRAVGLDGVIRPFAGTGAPGFSGDGGPQGSFARSRGACT